MGVPEAEWPEWLDSRDRVPNLQLLEGLRNIKKNAAPLHEWLNHLSPEALSNFKANNYFPVGVECEFNNFRTFYAQRKEILKRELRKVLAMTHQPKDSASQDSTVNDLEQEPRPNRPPAEARE